MIFFRALPLPPGGGCGSGASGLPAPLLAQRVCALVRAPYRPLVRGLAPASITALFYKRLSPHQMNPQQTLLAALEAEGLWERRVELKRHQWLKLPGTLDTQVYWIEQGSLRVCLLDEEQEHVIRFGYQGNIITALDAFISQQPSELGIQALKQTSLLAMSRARFLSFIQAEPSRIWLWTQLLEQLIYQQLEREKDLLTASPWQRYQRVLKRSPQLFQEIPHKYIAAYLRMTPETLSRLKKS